MRQILNSIGLINLCCLLNTKHILLLCLTYQRLSVSTVSDPTDGADGDLDQQTGTWSPGDEPTGTIYNACRPYAMFKQLMTAPCSGLFMLS